MITVVQHFPEGDLTTLFATRPELNDHLAMLSEIGADFENVEIFEDGKRIASPVPNDQHYFSRPPVTGS